MEHVPFEDAFLIGKGKCPLLCLVYQRVFPPHFTINFAPLGTNISPEKSILKMIFLFPRWDMLIP